jgi:carbonic anhydrase/acetyltransferase-like protein (isoleucine patch superfamily)
MVDSRNYEFEGHRPTVDEDAHVARGASLVGDVTVEAGAAVWPGAVLRGDIGPVHIGAEAHVGDNAVLHDSQVGEEAMVGHGAVLNDATVEPGSLVGINATVNTDAVVGSGSIVASGTVVPTDYEVPPESFVRGVPATTTPLAETTIDVDSVFEAYASGAYTDLAERHEELFE